MSQFYAESPEWWPVCGRKQDGRWVPIMLSSRHNADNAEEVERISREHPGEEGIIRHGRLLGWLTVTRGALCERTWIDTELVHSPW